LVHRSDLPGIAPARIGERVATLGGPAVHQRKSVPQVIGMRGDDSSSVRGAGSLFGGKLFQRGQKTGITGVHDESTLTGCAGGKFSEEAGEDRSEIGSVH